MESQLISTATNINQSVRFVTLAQNLDTERNRMHPASQNIPLIDEVYWRNPETGREGPRIIRYLKGESTIFADEQTNPVLSGPDAPRMTSNLVIGSGGYIDISTKETLLLEYLRTCNFNQNTLNRMPGKVPLFKELQPEKEAEITLEKETETVNLLNMVLKSSIDDIRQYAIALNLPGAHAMNEKTVRNEVYRIAKANPTLLGKVKVNPAMKRLVNIRDAVYMGVIKIDVDENRVIWNNGEEILRAPVGMNPEEYFAENSIKGKTEKAYKTILHRMYPETYPNPEGNPYESEIERLRKELESLKVNKEVDSEEVQVTPPTPNTESHSVVKGGISRDDAEEIFEMALLEGRIEKQGSKHYYLPGETKMFANKRKAAIDKIWEDEEFRKKVTQEE